MWDGRSSSRRFVGLLCVVVFADELLRTVDSGMSSVHYLDNKGIWVS